MSTVSFIKDKAGELCISTVGAAVIMLFVYAYRNSGEEAAILGTVLLLTEAARLLWELMRKKGFYDKMSTDCKALDKKYLLCEMLGEPGFYEGRLLKSALYDSNKSMCEQVALYRRRYNEFREYIELWVHEIKLPVAGLTLMSHNDGEKGRRYAAELKRIDACIENVLYYARIENAEKDYMIKKTDLKQAVKEVLVNNRTELQEHGAQISTSGLEREVYTDVKWLTFIIGQLLDNSIKYADSTQGTEIEISARDTDEGTVLSISDNGIGIPEGELRYVFEKSFTGSNGRTGRKSTGMGLYLVKKLCDKLGHKAEIFSETGKYTRVEIVFCKK